MGSWMTVWSIASKRYETNQGENTLSDHAMEILQAMVMIEQHEAMKDALGGFYGFVSGGTHRTGDLR